ncbi:MAG: phospho-N-acetylmuramoyl-pentapeptide-transferase [Candidatus Auribacter fodinae]|jgi:phospho-N-acetylmuramoyl-pentapeptide-transferase|uniref:Phospho-N-acetylmuramoyl-pentapeptide-transferase n=1 Tax=Candidatus Auribacter fodinae TaxID=2093366 RepID=A0A3A4RFC0_9BACT|nr:MAG: phospho-N-acetylmuramoyl-pentapeptide-transferase [Candidatus Auribacter fodinae]
MFYHLLYPLKELFFGFNVFRYITFRAAFAAVTAMILSIALGPYVIRQLYQLKAGQPIRKDECLPLYAKHHTKKGTPTMGGMLVLLSIVIPTLLWADLSNENIIIAVIATVYLGVVGFVDDYLKVSKKNSKGLAGRKKFLAQSILGLSIGAYLLFLSTNSEYAQQLHVPFFKDPVITHMGIFAILFTALVIVGTSNAVNLTDGLDGLAIGCVVACSLAYVFITYITGHMEIAKYLHITYIPGAGELAVFCATIAGAGLGFLWFNAYPAQIFMGDTGSLALGGAMGVVAVLIKKELLLLIIGGIFVVEAMSVMLQVASFKLRGKRIFLMSPIHHHFEMKGWQEAKITIRFWILAIIFALIGLGTLKLR